MSIARETLDPLLSLQLWTLRDLGGAKEQAAAAADAGYALVEPYGGLLAAPKALAAALTTNGLTAPTAHVGMSDLRADPARLVETCGTLQISTLFMPAFSAEERTGDADHWRRLGAELGALAGLFSENGIGFGYHNHFWEFERPDGNSTALELLFEGAEGSGLSWQADLAWIARAGEDPLAWMDRLSNRLASIHIKDMAPEGENLEEDGWCDFGTGTLDLQAFWTKAHALHAAPVVVEHDKPSRPGHFAKQARDYLMGALS